MGSQIAAGTAQTFQGRRHSQGEAAGIGEVTLQLRQGSLRELLGRTSSLILGWRERRRSGNVAVVAGGGLRVFLELCIFPELLLDPGAGAAGGIPGGAGGFP